VGSDVVLIGRSAPIRRVNVLLRVGTSKWGGYQVAVALNSYDIAKAAEFFSHKSPEAVAQSKAISLVIVLLELAHLFQPFFVISPFVI
jgi:hypothetical protein